MGLSLYRPVISPRLRLFGREGSLGLSLYRPVISPGLRLFGR